VSGGDGAMLFILGTGRCGTSLLHEVVARHRETGFISNIDDRLSALNLLGHGNTLIYERVSPRLTRKGRLRFAPSEAYRLLDRQVSPVISQTRRDLVADDVTPWMERRLRQFFESRSTAQGARVFTHKLTGWPRVGFLQRVFPEARFIHVVRDGRAVANSWLQTGWWRGWEGPTTWRWGPLTGSYAEEWEASNRSFPLLAGIAWKVLIDAFEAARGPVSPERWLELRYEDLVRRPRETVTAALAFADLPWTAAFERSFGRQRFGTQRETAYLRDLDRTSLALLDASLRTHLRRFGYGYPDAPPTPC
jgi:Sulfotransferase family